MLLVVDTNIVFSALVTRGATLDLLYFGGFELFSPEFIWSEISKYEKLIAKKSSLSFVEIEFFLNKIKSNIATVPEKEYLYLKEKALEILRDKKDWTFLALALQLNAGIWSNDKEFKEQNKVKVYTTKELLEFVLNRPKPE